MRSLCSLSVQIFSPGMVTVMRRHCTMRHRKPDSTPRTCPPCRARWRRRPGAGRSAARGQLVQEGLVLVLERGGEEVRVVRLDARLQLERDGERVHEVGDVLELGLQQRVGVARAVRELLQRRDDVGQPQHAHHHHHHGEGRVAERLGRRRVVPARHTAQRPVQRLQVLAEAVLCPLRSARRTRGRGTTPAASGT